MSFFTLFFASLFIILTNAAENSSVSQAPAPSTFCNGCLCEAGPEDTLIVDCHKRRLNVFPDSKNFPKKVIKLDLSHNFIGELKEIPLGYEKLEWLALPGNDLKVLSASTFGNVKALKYLDLSYNKIESFHERQFDSLEVLETLNFSYCRIERFPDDMYRNLNLLVHLDMSHNPIRFLQENLFRPLNHLTTLIMAHNEIYSLRTDVFASMQFLHILDLSGNSMEQVPSEALRAAHNLQELDLSENPIKDLNYKSFKDVSSLRSIKLRKMNKLFEIHDNTFSTLYNLEDLIVEDNHMLTYISSSAFYGIFNKSKIAIKNVSFKRNRLTTLAQSTLPFCNLTSLDLRENPWTCDCHLSWIYYCHERAHIIPNVECSAPKEMRAHFVDSLNPALLTCDNDKHADSQNQNGNAAIFYLTFFLMCSIFCLAILLFKLRYAEQSADKHSSIYYVKAQTDTI